MQTMELFNSLEYIAPNNRERLAPPDLNTEPVKRKQNRLGKKQKKFQLVLLERSQSGTWVEKPLSQYGWFKNQINFTLSPAKPCRKKKERVIDWTSTLTLEAYDKWLVENYKTCEAYAVDQSKKMLIAFIDISDCLEEAGDALQDAVIKIRNILEEGPLSSGSFIRYTKIAIKRLLLDRNRRGYAVRAERFSGYRYSIEDEYNRGVEIDQEPGPDDVELTQMIVSWLEKNYESKPEVKLWLYCTRDGKKSEAFIRQCRAMKFTPTVAAGIVERVMIYLQHHIKGLSADQLIQKLKS